MYIYVHVHVLYSIRFTCISTFGYSRLFSDWLPATVVYILYNGIDAYLLSTGISKQYMHMYYILYVIQYNTVYMHMYMYMYVHVHVVRVYTMYYILNVYVMYVLYVCHVCVYICMYVMYVPWCELHVCIYVCMYSDIRTCTFFFFQYFLFRIFIVPRRIASNI